MNNIIDIIKDTNNLNLLYVEDNESARTSATKMFKDFFKNVIIAVDGLDGIEKFKENDIDLIITDIQMPKMNGLDMLEQIKKIDSEVLTLVLSAYNEPEYFIQSIRIGVDGYILKPITLKQFISSLSTVIDKVKAAKDKALLNQYKEVVDSSAVVSIVNTDNKITYVNDSFCQFSEYTKEELLGSDYRSITKTTKDAGLYREVLKRIRVEKKIWKGIIKHASKSGKVYYFDTTIKPLFDVNGKLVEYMALRHDITAVMSPLKRLNDLIDSLKVPMLVLLKIEGFSDIKNCYGLTLTQTIEELVLVKLLKCLPKELGFEDIFALGEGEYAICRERPYEDMQVIIGELQKFQTHIASTSLDMGKIDIDISIIASLSYGEDTLENAKYGINRLLISKQNYILANNLLKEEHSNAQENIKILSKIKRAIEDKRVVSYFQGIVDNKTQEIVKYESLVRIIDEDGTVISPAKFLETSKKAKYYTQITSIVLDNALEALQKTDKGISINFSMIDIENPVIIEKFFRLFQEKKHALRVTVELLEDEESKDFEVIKSFIVKAKDLGIKIAIDDFGSGYSNFERLLGYQPDILKIDGSLVKNILTDEFSYSIVKTVIGFAKEQKLEVIAEYVENQEIYEVLCTLGADYSQGYHFAKPEPLK